MSKTILVFHASRRPNANGEYNWYEFKSLPVLSAKVYSDIIGCSHVTLIPNVDAKSKLCAYADDEGLCSDDYSRNDLAGLVLYSLGFRDSHILGFAYANTVIVTGNSKSEDRGLTEKEQTMLKDAITKARKSYNSESESEETTESTTIQEPEKPIIAKKKRERQEQKV